MTTKYYIDCFGDICNTENPPEFCHLVIRTEGANAPYEVVDVVENDFHTMVMGTYALLDEEGLFNVLKRRFEFNED